MLLCCSSIDGKQFVGGHEYYLDEQDQQEYFIQGKYSMGLSLFSINFNTFNSCCMCHLDRDSLEIELIPCLLWEWHWVALLVLN